MAYSLLDAKFFNFSYYAADLLQINEQLGRYEQCLDICRVLKNYYKNLMEDTAKNNQYLWVLIKENWFLGQSNKNEQAIERYNQII